MCIIFGFLWRRRDVISTGSPTCVGQRQEQLGTEVEAKCLDIVLNFKIGGIANKRHSLSQLSHLQGVQHVCKFDVFSTCQRNES